MESILENKRNIIPKHDYSKPHIEFNDVVYFGCNIIVKLLKDSYSRYLFIREMGELDADWNEGENYDLRDDCEFFDAISTEILFENGQSDILVIDHQGLGKDFEVYVLDLDEIADLFETGLKIVPFTFESNSNSESNEVKAPDTSVKIKNFIKLR